MVRSAAHKVALLFGHVTFIALLVLAWKHADIRTTSGDSAYQIFKWVNDAGLNVEAHRYTAIFPQLAVKVFKYFHADLRTLLLVASMAHVLVAYFIFLLCLLTFRAHRSAMAAALAAVLCTRLTFYGPVLEANYLLCYPFLFFAVLERNGLASFGVRPAAYLVVAGALTLLVHPLGWLILLYGIVFLWSVHQIKAKTAVAVAAVVALGATMVRWLFPPTAYEQAQYSNLLAALSGHDMGSPWGSWDFLAGHTFRYTNNYLPALVIFLLVVVVLMVRKQWKASAILGFGVVGFLGLVLITFRHGDAAIMMDRAFLPVATLIALPSIWLLWDLWKRWAMVGTGLLVLVLFIKLRDISFASREPGRQLERTEQLLADLRKHSIAKAEVTQVELQARKIHANWAFPFGTLLISSCDGPDHSITVRVQQESAIPKGSPGSLNVAPVLSNIVSNLNARYFRLPAGPYVPFPSTFPGR